MGLILLTMKTWGFSWDSWCDPHSGRGSVPARSTRHVSCNIRPTHLLPYVLLKLWSIFCWMAEIYRLYTVFGYRESKTENRTPPHLSIDNLNRSKYEQIVNVTSHVSSVKRSIYSWGNHFSLSLLHIRWVFLFYCQWTKMKKKWRYLICASQKLMFSLILKLMSSRYVSENYKITKHKPLSP